MNSLLLDVRYALRRLAKSPGFTLAAVLSLALGIGANATIFTWIDAVLVRPFPGVASPERLVVFTSLTNDGGAMSTSYPTFADFRERGRQWDLIAFDDRAFSLKADGAAERIWGLIVSGNYFEVLGVKALEGRLLTPGDDRVPGGHPVAVMSHGLWQRRFGRDKTVVGRTVSLNAQSFTIVGIAPPDFHGTSAGLTLDLYVPLAMQPQVVDGGGRLDKRYDHWLQALARVKPGVTLEQAQAEVDAIAAALRKEYPNSHIAAQVAPLWRSPEGGARVLGQVLFVLSGVAFLVLLIACANIANLLLAQAVARRREIAVRLSLGASRARLLRQLLTESLALGLLGGLAGVYLASLCSGLILFFAPPTDLPIGLDVGLDARTLAFTFALSLLTALLFGLVPAIQTARADLAPTLKAEGVAIGRGAGRGLLRGGLVVTQVALSLVLLVAAGLLIRSVRNATRIDAGFEPRAALLASVDLFGAGYDAARGRAFVAEALDRLRALPGVASASVSRRIPLGLGGTSSSSIEVLGYVPPPKEFAWAFYNTVGPDYVRAVGARLAAGRDFATSDTADAPPVVMVNETMARRYWPGRDAVGGRLKYLSEWFTVVGVVKDIKYRALNERPSATLFLPVLQAYRPDLTFHLRAPLGADLAPLAAALRAELRRLDPGLPIYNERTLEQWASAGSFQQRLAGSLLGAFGALALLLCSLGLYGLLAHSVGQRTREIGIRLALGGAQADIFRMVVREGMRLTAIGLALGTAGALAAGKPLSSLLLGVKPTDPATLVFVVALLALVAFAATALPARRATLVNPIEALRHE